jgi:putative DNA primase/helicase
MSQNQGDDMGQADTFAASLGITVQAGDGVNDARVRLGELVAQSQAEDLDKQSLRVAIAGLVSGEWLGKLAAFARHSPDEYERACMTIGSVHGLSGHVKTLRAKVRGKAKGLTLAADESGPSWLPDGWSPPPTWAIGKRGIVGPDPRGDGDITVSQVPLAPVGRMLDLDTGDHHVRLMWPGWSGAVYDRVVRQSVTVDSRTLVGTLGDHGAGVTTGNAGMVVKFLNEALMHNQDVMPVEYVTARCGWVESPEGKGFVLGRTWVGSGAPVRVQVEPGSGEEQILDAVCSRGDWDGWLRALAHGALAPSLHLAVYGSVASVLLSFLGIEAGYVIDWSGMTSQGKTTVLRAAASVWGKPTDGAMVQSWNLTQSRAEGTAHLLYHLPIILDDSKNARRAEDVATLIYQHSQGQSKGRAKPGQGSQAVGLRRSSTWRSVMLSTGEQSATSFSQDGGSRARCLCITGSPLRSREEAELVTLGVLDHYGHLGARVARWLADRTPEQVDTLRALYKRRHDEYGAVLALDGAVAGRLSALVALLAVSKAICERVGYPAPPDDCDPLGMACDAARSGGEDADRPLAALRSIYGHCVARSTAMWGRHVLDDGEPKQPNSGWLGAWPVEKVDGLNTRGRRWVMAIRPDVVHEVLAKAGYDRGCVDRWKERGWLVQDARGWTPRATVGPDGRLVCYCLSPAGVTSAQDADGEDKDG